MEELGVDDPYKELRVEVDLVVGTELVPLVVVVVDDDGDDLSTDDVVVRLNLDRRRKSRRSLKNGIVDHNDHTSDDVVVFVADNDGAHSLFAFSALP